MKKVIVIQLFFLCIAGIYGQVDPDYSWIVGRWTGIAASEAEKIESIIQKFVFNTDWTNTWPSGT
jgi:hypothetical protein